MKNIAEYSFFDLDVYLKEIDECAFYKAVTLMVAFFSEKGNC